MLQELKNKLIRMLGGVPADFGSNAVSHAKIEFDHAWPDRDDMQQEMVSCLTDVVAVFAAQRHSGFSASYFLAHIVPLLRFKPLSPLTGADSEWIEVGDGLYQNSRFGEVFKEGAGNKAYWSCGRVFRDKEGNTYTSRDSRVPIEFPFRIPDSPEIVDVEE